MQLANNLKQMINPFIVYLKNKASSKFEHKRDVSKVVQTGQGYLITFNNGKTYNYGTDKVQYYPYILTQEGVRIYENGELKANYNIVDNYGKYLIFRNDEYCSEPIENSSKIEICALKPNIEQAKSIIRYFKDIFGKSGNVSFEIPTGENVNKNADQVSSEILVKTLDKIDVEDPRTALSNYLSGTNPQPLKTKETFIYPFGCNMSQKLAVETCLTNSISIVEGPPGTGKTQTILNIIANLIVQKKSVAIVSNNNSAVFNIQEKLQKYGYGMLVASLGNNKNIKSFFDNIEPQSIDSKLKLSKDRLYKAKKEIKDLNGILTKCFQYRNKLAELKTQLADAEVEFNHVKSEQHLSQKIKGELDKKFHRKLVHHKALKLKEALSYIALNKKFPFLKKLQLIIQYGLFDINIISTYQDELYVYLNHKFYESYINKIKLEISDTERWLNNNNESSIIKHFVTSSKTIFDALLYEKHTKLKKENFKQEDYKIRFDDFINHYPVILSSTLCLCSCTPKDYIYDYLIIDESSQVDIIKAAVCFSCSRNLVIVGDSMQLSHIVNENNRDISEQLRNYYQVPQAYNYIEKNILDSLKCLYGDKIKSVLLKEHYRCHPTIIGFCNKKYYDNNLAIMTDMNNHPFKIIETNISGARGTINQRQIDETELYLRENYANDYSKVGVISPYRKHADKLKMILPAETEADTIHKYQGREKETIIFNTVRNQINDFIDNPNLINVAVSRAVKEFIVVKPEAMELPHGTNIGDMIRYICYATDQKETIVKGKICSAFDLLYKEYNKLFVTFIESNSKLKGSAAEMIIHKLLTEEILLPNSRFSSVDMVREYKLRDIIRNYEPFTEEEIAYIRNNSRLDFLLYSKIDKTPILAIEVDGVSFHNNGIQQERDNKKNNILNSIGLPILRLSTDGHDEKDKIVRELSKAMGIHI